MDNISNIMAAIVAIMKNNGLTELSLGDYAEQEDPTFIIWFDNDGTPYDDPAIKVIVENSEISVEVEARDFSNNVTLQDYEIDRLEWWQGLHAGGVEDSRNGWQTPLSGLRKTASCPAEILLRDLPEIRNAPADTAKGSRTGKQTHSETYRLHRTGKPETQTIINRRIFY